MDRVMRIGLRREMRDNNIMTFTLGDVVFNEEVKLDDGIGIDLRVGGYFFCHSGSFDYVYLYLDYDFLRRDEPYNFILNLLSLYVREFSIHKILDK